jgi:hypothetical protein
MIPSVLHERWHDKKAIPDSRGARHHILSPLANTVFTLYMIRVI